MDNIRVTDAKSLRGHMMLVTFSTGEQRSFDASNLGGSSFKPLEDDNVFHHPVIFRQYPAPAETRAVVIDKIHLTSNRLVTIIKVTDRLLALWSESMMSDTKERILETALELFAQNGYLGTSMSEIARELNLTKAALYKHYAGKQEILDCIIERMQQMDYERAEQYEMPETEPDGFAEAYMQTPVEQIRAYSMAQFNHWTKESFSANFRKMLTLEQYRSPEMAQLHHDYLAGGPLSYMAAIFRKLTDSDEAAMQLALEFYGPMYLLYSVYDEAEDKDAVAPVLEAHINRFIARVESTYRKDRESL